MYDVEFSAKADAAFDALPPGDRVEILQKLDTVEKVGVRNEVAIATVNLSYFVHVLSPPCPPRVITIYDSLIILPTITVTHIEIIDGLDYFTKHRLATEAAAAIGVAPTHARVF